jgi:hypothetical protein
VSADGVDELAILLGPSEGWLPPEPLRREPHYHYPVILWGVVPLTPSMLLITSLSGIMFFWIDYDDT